jgi:ribosomal protein S18 acetylase RimI-like enzyme
MDEASELFQLCSPAFQALFGGAEGFESRSSQAGALSLSGEPHLDFNLLFLAQSADASAFLRQGVSRAVERGLPLTVVMTPVGSKALIDSATDLGLAAGDPLPLMVLREAPRSGDRCCGLKIERAIGASSAATAGELISSAFDLPRGPIARVLERSMALSGGPEVYLAYRNGVPTSAVSVTVHGQTYGVWSMATPKAYRGQGIGRTLLTEVIAGLRARGGERVFLFASKDGRDLYDRMGFQSLLECPTWVLSGDRASRYA